MRRQFRKRSRVYIFPTKMGGYLNGLIFLMFLLSVGYANNLLLIFTTLLLAFDILWLIQTHFHLYRLKFDHLTIYSGHALSPISVQLFWKATPNGPMNWEIELESDHGDLSFKSLKESSEQSTGEIIPLLRGAHKWKYLRVKTVNPYGLYQSWIYFPLGLETLIYPSLVKNVEIPFSGKNYEGELPQDKKGPEDFRGLSTYADGESRKISWKHYARSGELLVKEGEEMMTPLLDLELNPPGEEGAKEAYLSYLATQIVECHRRDIPFSLKINQTSSSHLQDCLKVLALC